MIQYTREDLIKLYEMSNETSPVRYTLQDFDFDPDRFQEWMKQMPKEYRFVYDTELDDIPLEVDNPTIQGFLNWRFGIYK